MIISLDNLWSGAAGAVLVALFTVGYTEIREARQRVRARIGYARLLEAEIQSNSRVTEVLSRTYGAGWKDMSPAAGYWLTNSPSAEAWREVREPLAALITPEDFGQLDAYYRRIGVFMDLMEHPPVSETEETRGLTAQELAASIEGDVPRLRSMLSRYVNPPRRVQVLGF